MNAWDRSESGDVGAVSEIVVERIRYSVLVTVDVVACF